MWKLILDTRLIMQCCSSFWLLNSTHYTVFMKWILVVKCINRKDKGKSHRIESRKKAEEKIKREEIFMSGFFFLSTSPVGVFCSQPPQSKGRHFFLKYMVPCHVFLSKYCVSLNYCGIIVTCFLVLSFYRALIHITTLFLSAACWD